MYRYHKFRKLVLTFATLLVSVGSSAVTTFLTWRWLGTRPAILIFVGFITSGAVLWLLAKRTRIVHRSQVGIAKMYGLITANGMLAYAAYRGSAYYLTIVDGVIALFAPSAYLRAFLFVFLLVFFNILLSVAATRLSKKSATRG